MPRLLLIVTLFAALIIASPAAAQDGGDSPPADGPPFALPFSDPPGPETWLYQQHYGNTTQAFNYGDVWYEFGQGMHFGLDFFVPCGTPVRAIADGVVVVVDASGFGAGPHNLVLDHPGTGYASLYGHLLELPALRKGDPVQRGDVIGLSGDPDGSCGSRPHLHLEIRSSNFQTAYNPLPFFDVNWDMLTSIGPYNNNYQQDLDYPYRWMRLDDQPEIQFSGPLRNNYAHPWPRKLEVRAPVNPPPHRDLDPLPEGVEVTITPVALDAWNLGAWWRPDDPDAVYLIDAIPGQQTGVFRQPLDGSPRQYVQPAPPTNTSPDGAITVERLPDEIIQITRTGDGATFRVDTGGVYPAIAPGGERLLYEVVYGEVVPGTSTPGVVIWAADIDGTNLKRVYSGEGSYSMWLDDHRVLVIQRITYTPEYRLYVVDLDADTPEPQPELLARINYLQGLQIAPGGEHIAFFRTFQEDSRENGVFVLRTAPGSTPRKLPFFGGYRWRDADSLFVLSYGIDDDAHALGVVGIEARAVQWLTDPAEQPIRIANGEWSVSPDGARLVYVDADDFGLYQVTFGDD